MKVAIIKQIRKFIGDDTLGLKDLVMIETPPVKLRNPGPLVLPPDGNPLDDPDRGKPAPSPTNPNASLDGPTFRAASFATISGAAPIHFVKGLGSVQEGKEKKAPEEDKEKKAPEKAPNPIVIPFPGQGQVKITIEVQGQNAGVLLPFFPQKPEEGQVPPPESEGEQTWKIIPPQDSERVFVDVTAYHSRNYYVLGDVLTPGRLPFTGSETVLDAIQYAGGLLPTADPKEIRLVRPGREGKPSKVYTVDLEAIQERGDVRANYQLFPGDRLIFGRNEIVKRTIEIDRLNAPIQEVVTSIRQNADMLKSLGALSPERSDQVLKDLVDFWAKEVARKGDIKFDEQTLREILLRELRRAPSASRPTPAPGAR